MSRELDTLVAAQIFGWTDIRMQDFKYTEPLLIGMVPEGYRAPVPSYSTDIAAAWLVVERLRDMWTTATEGVDGLDNTFPRPFDDGAFFDKLHRHADRRWPWAFLYVTPEALCRAALAAVHTEE